MDDFSYINEFIKTIVDRKQKEIIGLAVTKKGRFSVSKSESKIAYLLSLMLIMGIKNSTRQFFTILWAKIKCALSQIFPFIASPSILNYAKDKGIPIYTIGTANDNKLIEILRRLNPDVIVNQSQDVLGKEFLSIPKIGVLNRHNSLLPKNRGRLSPFWCIYKSDKETGVSIHFVTEKIDGGEIVVQKKVPIEKDGDFISTVKKCYHIAPEAMIEALDLLERGSYSLIQNSDFESTENSIPSLKQVFSYRSMLWKKRRKRK